MYKSFDKIRKEISKKLLAIHEKLLIYRNNIKFDMQYKLWKKLFLLKN